MMTTTIVPGHITRTMFCCAIQYKRVSCRALQHSQRHHVEFDSKLRPVLRGGHDWWSLLFGVHNDNVDDCVGMGTHYQNLWFYCVFYSVLEQTAVFWSHPTVAQNVKAHPFEAGG